jgi:tripartite-type tricarboxylate transporter receptor subunit TctC
MRIKLGLLVLLSWLFAMGSAAAQTWPEKPIRVILGFPPGVGSDIGTRLITVEMTKRLGQPFIVENRLGAAGSIAVHLVADAKPDGYTLFSGPTQHLDPVFMKNNSIVSGKDISPIADYAAVPIYFFARTSLGVKTLQDLISYSKAHPGKLNYGSQVAQTDLIMETIKADKGLTYQTVRFTIQPLVETMAGDIDFFGSSLQGGTLPAVQSGKLVALIGTRKLDLMPNTPSSTDLGFRPFPEPHFGFWGPPALALDIRQRLAGEITLALKTPAAVDMWQKQGMLSVPSTPEDQQRTYDAAIEFYKAAAKVAHFEPQ